MAIKKSVKKKRGSGIMAASASSVSDIISTAAMVISTRNKHGGTRKTRETIVHRHNDVTMLWQNEAK